MSREAVGRALVAKCIADAVKNYIDEQKAEAVATMTAGDRLAYAQEGTMFGVLTMTKGSSRAVITDPALFLSWVRVTYPERIVEAVDPAFQERIVHTATRLEAPCDVETGEIIPGLTIVTGDPYPMLRPTVELKRIVKDRMLGLTQSVIESGK